MGIDVATGSADLSLVLSALSEVFTDRNILFIFCLILLLLILYIYILFRGSRWILKFYGAQQIERSERSLLYSIIEELSKEAGVTTPDFLSFESTIPEMFTVGNGIKSSITVSTAMLEMFDEIELEVLLAHEIGHIKNKDVALNTVTAFLAGLIMSIPYLVMWGSLLIGFGQPEDPAPRFFKFMATAFAAPPAAVLIHLTNPTKKEFAADEQSIKLTGNPRTLAKTLEYLENYIPLQPVTIKLNPGHFHLFSTHTQQLRGYLSIFISLFDTHPGIEDRVAHILKFSNNPEQGASYSKFSRVPGFFDLRNWRLALAASLISYFSFLLVIIVVTTFAMKDFNFTIAESIAGVYIVAVLLLIVTTAKLSRRKHYLK
jgi:heat shock protein HtpX